MSDDKPQDARSGWRSRRAQQRNRRRSERAEDRAAGNAARAAIIAGLQQDANFNPEVHPSDHVAVEAMVKAMSDVDLAGLYKQLTGKDAKPDAKRKAVERAVLKGIAEKAEAERAAAEEAAAAIEEQKQFGRDMFAAGDPCPEETEENISIRAGWLGAQAAEPAADDTAEGDV
jgi:hypothetical protein